MSVLVLNKNWQPVHICSVERAISLIFQNAAKVVDRDYQIHGIDSWREFSELAMEMGNEGQSMELVRSPSLALIVPEVILLMDYHKIPPFNIRLNRRNLFLRDDFECQYCGSKKDLTTDHIVPRSKGGKTTWDNVVLACSSCNSKKGSKDLKDSGLHLRTQPKRPSWPTMLKKKRSEDIQDHPLWTRFIDQAYWNVTLKP